jgi:hypothetical protein
VRTRESQGGMSEDLCRCPVLLAAAEADRLVEIGLEVGGYNATAALIIGRLRQEHGCRGPRYGRCAWAMGLYHISPPVARTDVPYLKGNATGKNTGEYL